MLESNSLWLKREPTVEMIIAEFEKYDLTAFKEVVFCGFGEPLTRHDDLMKVAKYISEFFVKQGVTDMFMITGGAAMHLNDAFGHQEGLKIT